MISRDYIVGVVRELLADLIVQTRRGTTSQWAASTRPLRDGEQGWNKTTKEIYVGNGSAVYPNYDVVASGPSGPADLSSLAAGAPFYINWTGTAWPDRGSDRADIVGIWRDRHGNATFPTDALEGDEFWQVDP